jgi:hypothetical protein
MAKHTYREGFVYAIPLGTGYFGYFLCADFLWGGWGVFYNFVSDRVIADAAVFSESAWLRPFRLEDSRKATCFPIAEVAFDLRRVTPMVIENRIDLGGGQYELCKGIVAPYLSNPEAMPEGREADYFEYLDLDDTGGPQSMVAYINANRESFRLVQGTEDPPAMPDTPEDEEPEIAQLEVYIDTGKCGIDCEILAEDIESALDDAFIAGCEMIDGSDGEVIVRVDYGEATRAAAVIRKQLRRCLSPEEIQSAVDFYLNVEGKEMKELPILPVSRKKAAQ